MKDRTRQYEHQRQVARLQSEQELQNCILLCAYVFGQPGGWYMIAHGEYSGFRSDYALVHSLVGNIRHHKVRAIYAVEPRDLETYADEISEISTAVCEERQMEDPPLVAVFTQEEIEQARLAVRAAIHAESPDDIEKWLRNACESTASDLTMCDWGATVAAVTRK